MIGICSEPSKYYTVLGAEDTDGRDPSSVLRSLQFGEEGGSRLDWDLLQSWPLPGSGFICLRLLEDHRRSR